MPPPAPPPRSMTAAEIAAVLPDVAARVVGGVVTRVREPLPDHIALEVRNAGRNFELVIGVAPGLARIHLAEHLPPTPPGPATFALRARKLLRPSRVTALAQVPGERVVTLTVSRHREAEGWETRLVAELFGRGRLFLLDGEGNILAWHGPGGPRGLAPGTPYAPPAGRPERADGAGGKASGPGAGGEAVDSAALETRYGAWLAERDARAARAEADADRTRARRVLERRIHAMERDVAALAGHEGWRREGELLAAHRHLLTRGRAEVTVTDWFEADCPERRIALDPALSPEENVEARFRRARRGARGVTVLAARLAEARERLARLDAGDEVAPARPARTRPGLPTGVRRFAAGPGWEVLVGRGAAENERLTFRVARGNDLWFHARDAAGAHVVLRGQGEPPPGAVRAAALLAAHFSRLKPQGGGEVLYTPRKYVRRLKGGRPGQVTVSQERVLHVALEADEVRRLLATRVASGGAPGP